MKALEGHKVTNSFKETVVVLPNLMQEAAEVMMNMVEVIVAATEAIAAVVETYRRLCLQQHMYGEEGYGGTNPRGQGYGGSYQVTNLVRSWWTPK